MNTFAPGVTVQAPQRSPLPFGVFSVFQPQSSQDRWIAGGITWEALTCGEVLGLPGGDVGLAVGDSFDFSHGRATYGHATPFSVQGVFESSVGGVSGETDVETFAEQHLLSGEQTRVEQALWTGDLNNVPNLAGDPSAEGYPAPELIGHGDPVAALALAEEYIGAGLGFMGVIHIPRALASVFASEGLIAARGGVMLTKLETPVVVGSGYSGSVIRVSPPLFGYRSDVTSWATFNTNDNTFSGMAVRDYVVGFDPCGVAEIEVTLDSGNGGGGGSTGPSEVTIIGTSSPLPVDVVTNPVPVSGEVNANLTNDSVPVSGSVSVSGTPNVNVANTPLPVEDVSTPPEGSTEG